MRYLLFCLAAAAGLNAQSKPPAAVRELVRESIRNRRRAWEQSFGYSCIKRDVDREYNSNGSVKSTDVDLYKIIPLGEHTSFEEHIEHDNEPLPADQLLKEQQDLAQRRAESPADKEQRFQKALSDRSYMLEVPDAFNFKITGVDNLPTGPAWVITAVPRPGFQPHSRNAHMFPDMRGTLWIDQKDVQWVKADAVAMDTVSFGFFVARLSKGSHIILEQMKLPDGSWVPKQIEARASARVFIFWVHNFREDITYSDYRKAPGATTAALR